MLGRDVAYCGAEITFNFLACVLKVAMEVDVAHAFAAPQRQEMLEILYLLALAALIHYGG